MKTLKVTKVRKVNRQAGGILVFLAIAMVALLSIVMLTIDSGVAFAARDQANHLTKLISLAALEEYFESGKNLALTPQQRYDLALKKARAVLASNDLLGPDAHPPFQLNDSESNQGMRLLPGVWQPDEKCQKGCKGDQACI